METNIYIKYFIKSHMKKSWVFFAIIILLLNILVSAQTSEEPKASTEVPKEKLSEKIDNIIDKEIIISENYAKIIRFVFGYKEPAIPLSTAIILITLWIALFIFIKKIVDLSELEFLKGQTSSIINSIIITLLIATFGGILVALNILKQIEEVFKIADRWSVGGLGLNILAIILALFIVDFIINFIKKQAQKEKEETAIQKIKFWFSKVRKDN